MRIIHFEIDSASTMDGIVRVAGRNHGLTIVVGDEVFSWANGHITSSFSVNSIWAYQKSINGLPSGMTGELELFRNDSRLLSPLTVLVGHCTAEIPQPEIIPDSSGSL
jgi:hypothetical protein